ncbi:MAG: large conductance mechanosensitive channel protein MscL [Acidimicrobiia bacterium]|jgi:large conductance mechanosensitive channel
MKHLLKDFRDFALKGNFIDLAVAVVIGVAFNAVVTSLVNDVVMPFIAAIIGKPNFDELSLVLGDTAVYYGKFLTALVNFLIIAATLFVVIRSFEELQKRAIRRGEVTEEETKPEEVQIQLLTEIRDSLRERA